MQFGKHRPERLFLLRGQWGGGGEELAIRKEQIQRHNNLLINCSTLAEHPDPLFLGSLCEYALVWGWEEGVCLSPCLPPHYFVTLA